MNTQTQNTETQLFLETAFRDYNGGYFSILVSHEQTNGAMSVVDMRLPKGSEPPVHLHNQEDEIFCILEGNVKIEIGDKTYNAKAGDTIFAPRRVSHRFEIQGDEARILITLTPGKFLDFFVEQSTPTLGAPQITPPQGPPPPEAIQYIIERLKAGYDVHFIAG